MSIVSNQPKKIDYKEAIREYEESIATQEEQKITYAASPLKWCGGKSKMISEFEEYYPSKSSKMCCEAKESTFNLLDMLNNTVTKEKEISEKRMEGIRCFIEPFVGGATNSIYISQKYPRVEQFYGSDALNDLINFYLVIQFYKEDFVELFNKLADNYNNSCMNDKDKNTYFTSVRTWFNKMSVPLCNQIDGVSAERAAGFYFLHITGFNNQYRVNAKGLFNTPPGKIVNCTIKEDSMIALTNLLSKMYVSHEDYSKSLNFIKHLLNPTEEVEGFSPSKNEKPFKPEEIFVYLDPPASQHGLLSTNVTNGVQSYCHSSQSVKRLAEYCNNLTELGIKWLATIEDNSSLKYFEEEYKGSYNKQEVLNKGVRNPSKKIQEVFIYNYDLIKE